MPDSPAPTITRIPADQITSTFSHDYIDLISSRLHTRVLRTSDEFFCAARNLQTPTPPVHKPHTFTAAGAWFDGWETRRHNAAPFDWVVFALGVRAARFAGVEIDTGFFSGNHAPQIAVQAASLPPSSSSPVTNASADGTGINNADAPTTEQDALAQRDDFQGWETILPAQECGPACRQAWSFPLTAKSYTHVRLQMFPDGGIARFRAFGRVVPAFPLSNPYSSAAAAAAAAPVGEDQGKDVYDLASVLNGGLATACSDQHFGAKDNLLLPGRGIDMGDGWETRRSRGAHVDWVVVRLGAPAAAVHRVVVDTAFFRGNFPQEIRLFAAEGEAEPPGDGEQGWMEMARFRGRPDAEHVLGREELRGVQGRCVRWVKMVIVPDGGVKRVRVFGRVAR